MKKLFVVPCYTVVYAKDDEEVEEIVRQYFDDMVEPDIHENQQFQTIDKITDIPDGWNEECPCLEMATDEDGDSVVMLKTTTIKDILVQQKKKDNQYAISHLEQEIAELQQKLKDLKR